MVDEPTEQSHCRRILASLRPILPERPVIWDIGASNGSWVWQAAQVYSEGEFHLFEPMWAVSDAYNAILDPVLRAIPSAHKHSVAVGSRTGSTVLHVTPGEVGSTTLDIDVGPDFAKPSTVPMVSVDAAVESGMAPSPHLIKMDIQGGELEALKGASNTLRTVAALHLETWLTREYGPNTPLLAEIASFLMTHGFRLFDFGEQFRHDDGRLYSVDACFIRAKDVLNDNCYVVCWRRGLMV